MESVEQRPESSAPAAAAEPPKKENILRRLYHWVLHWAETPYGTPALAIISFAESSFFPIPPDVLQIALSVSKPQWSFYYAAVNSLFSVLGGVLGWFIGLLFWASAGWFFFTYIPGFTAENFERVKTLYHENAFMAIVAAAFTPIPYKIFTIAAGVFHVDLTTLVLASIVGRSGRFFLVGTIIYFFGEKVKTLLEKYFELATLILFVLGVGGFVVVKYFL